MVINLETRIDLLTRINLEPSKSTLKHYDEEIKNNVSGLRVVFYFY